MKRISVYQNIIVLCNGYETDYGNQWARVPAI